MRVGLMVVMIATVAAASLAQEPKREAQGESKPEWDNFRVLVERNIFLRDRAIARPRSSSREPQQAIVRDPDEDLVLTGTVRQGQLAVAFVENTRSGRVQRAWAGDAVGSGKISAITLDDVEYVRNGTTKKIEIGRSLGSSSSTQPADTSQPTIPKSGTSDTADTASNGDAASILERMRRRRQQELDK